MQSCDCIDFGQLEKLVEQKVGIGDTIDSRIDHDSDLPPFSPMRFIKMLVDDSDGSLIPVIYDPTGCYRRFPLDRYKQIVRIPNIYNAEVQMWIFKIKDKYEGWYVHPTFGSFNPDLFHTDIKVYDGAKAPDDYYERLKGLSLILEGDVSARDEYFNPYIKPEYNLYLRFIRDWYPDYME